MLDQTGCQEEIQKHTDEAFVDFEAYLETEEDAINAWGDILDVCAALVTPVSTAAAAAKAAFESAATGMSDPVAGLAIFLAACDTYAATLMAGMTGYTVVTPVAFVALDFGDASLNIPGVSAEDAADYQATKIVARLQTGLMQLIVPPFTQVNLA